MSMQFQSLDSTKIIQYSCNNAIVESVLTAPRVALSESECVIQQDTMCAPETLFLIRIIAISDK